MSDLINDLLLELEQNADMLRDQTAGGGGGGYQLPEAGKGFAVLVAYIDVGNHPQRAYKGKDKPPAAEAYLGFELRGKKWETKDEEGKVSAPIYWEKVAVKGGDKAGSTKLIKALTYGRDAKTHLASFVGETFAIEVVHTDNGKEGDEKRVYANIRTENGWTIGSPTRMVQNPDDEDDFIEKTVKLKAVNPLMLYVWEIGSKNMWDSIFIDGVYTRTEKNDKGEEVEVEKSKNRFQNMIRKALNFGGSRAEQHAEAIPDLDGGATQHEEEKPKKPVEKKDAPVGDEDYDPLAE